MWILRGCGGAVTHVGWNGSVITDSEIGAVSSCISIVLLVSYEVGFFFLVLLCGK